MEGEFTRWDKNSKKNFKGENSCTFTVCAVCKIILK